MVAYSPHSIRLELEATASATRRPGPFRPADLQVTRLLGLHERFWRPRTGCQVFRVRLIHVITRYSVIDVDLQTHGPDPSPGGSRGAMHHSGDGYLG
jgi:hypothetical protein